MRQLLAAVLVTLTSASSPSEAQVLPEGARVRALIPTVSPGDVYGRVLVLTGDSITLRDVHAYVPEGIYFARRIAVPRQAVTRVEYMDRRDRATGAFYGAAVGLIPAVIAYYDAKRKDYREYAGLNAFLFGTISVPTFAVIGAWFGPEQWERVRPWP